MDLTQLRQLLELVREHELAELEIEQDGLRLKIRKDAAGATVTHLVGSAPQPVPGSNAAAFSTAIQAPAVSVMSPISDDEAELAVVKSPIVGTFYRSSSPGAPPFVDIGSAVKKGQALCIIEAMKLMNEIDSEYDGEVVSVYVESGHPVQYGERLFAIRAK